MSTPYSKDAAADDEERNSNDHTVAAPYPHLADDGAGVELAGIEKDTKQKDSQASERSSDPASSEEEEETSRNLQSRGEDVQRSTKALKQIQPWAFFDNQVFLAKNVDFGSQVFYSDGWTTMMGMALAKS